MKLKTPFQEREHINEFIFLKRHLFVSKWWFSRAERREFLFFHLIQGDLFGELLKFLARSKGKKNFFLWKIVFDMGFYSFSYLGKNWKVLLCRLQVIEFEICVGIFCICFRKLWKTCPSRLNQTNIYYILSKWIWKK